MGGVRAALTGKGLARGRWGVTRVKGAGRLPEVLPSPPFFENQGTRSPPRVHRTTWVGVAVTRRSTVQGRGARQRTRTVAAVLLDRRGSVYLPAAADGGAPGADPAATPDPLVAAGVALLEADLLDRGFLASGALVGHLQRLDVETLQTHGGLLLADIEAALGADRPHLPLFRGFPRSTPKDTRGLWVDRVVALLAQRPDQPCVLCGSAGTVGAVSPCGHLVCRVCFDGTDYGACPVCHRRIDPDDPFLGPTARRPRQTADALPARARVLRPGHDPVADAHRELDALLARTAALPPQDADDLRVLLGTRERDDLSWLPGQLPAREVTAVVLAWLLEDPTAFGTTLPAVTDRLGTATDALRMLAVRSGGDPGLVRVPRFGAVPRPIRRAVLAALDRIDPRTLAEDLRRHRTPWIHAAERLHPFEYARRYPAAAAAFAVLRRTRPPTGGPLADAVAAAVDGAGYARTSHRVVSRSFGDRVEQALAAGDVVGAVRLLAHRPGELLRRLDHLLRLSLPERNPGAGPVPVVPEDAGLTSAVLEDAGLTSAVLEDAVRGVSPAVLISALGAVRVRSRRQRWRVFFPRGGTARAHVVPDTREALPAALVDQVGDVLVGELLRRAALLPPVDVAVVDVALDDVVAPFTQRTASRALVTLPRGSTVPLPDDRGLRLFLHWMQGEQRVDLDLSAGMFDEAWQHIGTCDYTSMRYGGDAAVHSGDLTSAPPPPGASEFVDLDTDLLTSHGVRYVAACVFSFTNVAFEDIPEAFAGFMLRADLPDAGPAFDPRAVEQRFDLVGRHRGAFPLLLDLRTRRMHWFDITQGLTGTAHAVHRHAEMIAALGQSLIGYYGSGVRVGLGEVARWHAAARARAVLLRTPDGRTERVERRPEETPRDFLARFTTGPGTAAEPGPAPVGDGAAATVPAAVPAAGEPDPGPVPAQLAFLYRGDYVVADGAEAYALHPAALDAARVRLLAAADLAGALRPAAPAPAAG